MFSLFECHFAKKCGCEIMYIGYKSPLNHTLPTRSRGYICDHNDRNDIKYYNIQREWEKREIVDNILSNTSNSQVIL